MISHTEFEILNLIVSIVFIIWNNKDFNSQVNLKLTSLLICGDHLAGVRVHVKAMWLTLKVEVLHYEYEIELRIS